MHLRDQGKESVTSKYSESYIGVDLRFYAKQGAIIPKIKGNLIGIRNHSYRSSVELVNDASIDFAINTIGIGLPDSYC
ncbi:hypothetical protein D3C84_1093960 [compost metagenome]